MNINQRDQLLNSLKQFNTDKLLEVADANYKGKDWDAPIIETYTVTNFIEILTKCFRQLEETVKNSDYVIYPIDYNAGPHGAGSLQNIVTAILNCINEKLPFNDYFASIQWVIAYLLDFNLWNKEKNLLSINDLEEKHTTLDLLTTKTKQQIHELKEAGLLAASDRFKLVQEIEALDQLIAQKKQELTLISEAVPTVTIQKTEIDQTLKNVQKSDSDIRSIQKNHADLFEQLKTQKDNQEKDFKILQEKVTSQTAENLKLVEVILERLEFFNTQKGFIEQKRKEIIELGALAAGAALGGTYGLRKGEIVKDLNFWKWGVLISTLLAVSWAVVVFAFIRTETSNQYADIFFNLIKTTPGFILMGFVYKQYGRERTLQEEYAFKAAVANTIHAYSDLMKDESKAQENRNKMLTEVIKQVQTPPKFYTEGSSPLISLRSKTLNETLKNINDTLGTLKK